MGRPPLLVRSSLRLPPSLFPTALAEAYPTTPIILTTRSFDSWASSKRDTLIHAHLPRDEFRKSPMEGLANAYHSVCWDNDFEKNGEAYFQRHHEEVRVFRTDGRKFPDRFVRFLGAEVPNYKKKVEQERREADFVEKYAENQGTQGNI
ncbi:hypothetical protein CCUS01_13103 [Colletotrichum cuscutae]|uniref:Uncharacterized protein n=1 Tax=Colletotrichum cuscutae TaxID=1209917 RepID=A0AAJ0DPK0_9PEZI|nr:hypothetical protein CCUS01_13103 [Colletotrichum cuscutae]